MKFLQNKLVERTQMLILSSDMNLTEIAHKIEVPNLSLFFKFFHRQTCIFPRHYIQNRFINVNPRNRQ